MFTNRLQLVYTVIYWQNFVLPSNIFSYFSNTPEKHLLFIAI